MEQGRIIKTKDLVTATYLVRGQIFFFMSQGPDMLKDTGNAKIKVLSHLARE